MRCLVLLACAGVALSMLACGNTQKSATATPTVALTPAADASPATSTAPRPGGATKPAATDGGNVGSSSSAPASAGSATAAATRAPASATPHSAPPSPPPLPPIPGSTSDQEGIQSAKPVGSGCPFGYPIKGDAAARYHQPADPDYAATTPVVCFATVDDATAAGYTPAHAG